MRANSGKTAQAGRWLLSAAIVLLLAPSSPGAFRFSMTADMRSYSGPGTYDTSDYFRGACEALAARGAGAFMVAPGDIDPPADVKWTIEEVLGTDYLWYPVVGNHEAGDPPDMDYLRAYDYDANGTAPPNIVNTGPPNCVETCYSFDYENVHFVAINEYYDGFSDVALDGDVADSLYAWLADDLAATTQEHIIVLGHEPAYSQPDVDCGRERHVGDSLDKYPSNRNRFWDLLAAHEVIAYLCGHTHNYSAWYYNGVWQIDAGHARGAGDTGAPSTFCVFDVSADTVRLTTYRDDHDGIYDYLDIVHTRVLTDSFTVGIDEPVEIPEPGRLLSASPNPLRNRTTIRYALSASGTVRLSVYDITGRLVRDLVRGVKAEGPHIATWDGTNLDGEPVASGVYFCVLEADGTTTRRKIAVLR